MTETPETLIQRIYDEELGFRPTNFSIKPVHLANGLARALTGRSYKPLALVELLRQWVRNQTLRVDEERHPNSEIIDKYGAAFSFQNGSAVPDRTLTILRDLARDALGADGAVFDDPGKSSFTLSNECFITDDPSDNRCGAFLARLLTAGHEGDAARLLRTLLESKDDPWTTLALPMLNCAEVREVAKTGPQAELIRYSDHLFGFDESGKLRSPTLQRLREAFDRLGRFEDCGGSKLNSLRRMVLFGCFAIHVHMLGRWSEVQPGAARPLILLDMFDGRRPAIRDASRASLRAAGVSTESLLLKRIRDHIDAELGRGLSIEAILDQSMTEIRAKSAKRRKFEEQLRDRFRTHKEEVSMSHGDALAESFLELGIEVTGGHPVEFLTELGRRAGYLTPWANQGRGGKLQKRYGVTAEFLETLVAATIAPGEPVEFPEFCDALRDYFGVLLGRRQDDALIRANNLAAKQFGSPTSVSEEDLRENVEALRCALLETGFAKAYADGQTVVITG